MTKEIISLYVIQLDLIKSNAVSQKHQHLKVTDTQTYNNKRM